MHKTRLKRVADLLQRRGPYNGKRPIPAGKFYLTRWICGTTACAIGWAAKDPWFKAQGLKMRPSDYPVYGDATGWDAVADFFILKYPDAEHLFSSFRYPIGATADDVATRIREFIK